MIDKINRLGSPPLRWFSIGIAIIVVAGIVVFRFQRERSIPEPPQAENAATSLGLVYLPITETVSNYYGLGLHCGAMITEVSRGSPAAQAGIKVGDVITSFNGVPIDEETPLLGMMRECAAEGCITMGVWNGGASREVTIVQPATLKGNNQ